MKPRPTLRDEFQEIKYSVFTLIFILCFLIFLVVWGGPCMRAVDQLPDWQERKPLPKGSDLILTKGGETNETGCFIDLTV